MAYGTVKVDNITFTNGGIDQTITVSGIVQSISGDITATGTIQAGTVIGTSTVSGATVTGDSGQFITATAATGIFTSTLSGATITGNSANFTTITGGTVTLTSGVFASGTAAAPSVSVGTTDNGLYSPGADQVAISTNGAQALYINADGDILVADGNRMEIDEVRARDGAGLKLYDDAGAGIFVKDGGSVGIGTSSVSSQLDVRGFATDFDGLRVVNTNSGSGGATTSAIRLGITNSIGLRNARIEAVEGGADSNNVHLDFYTNSANALDGETFKMRLTSAGSLGIGTTSPGALLQVSAGTTETAGNITRFDTYYTGIADAVRISNQRDFGASNGRGMRLSFTTGDSTAGYLQNEGLSGSRVFSFINQGQAFLVSDRTNSVLTLSAPGTTSGVVDLNYRSGGTSFLGARIDSSGRLLVGTSTSRAVGGTIQSKLQIEGTGTGVNTTACSVTQNSDDVFGPRFMLAKSRDISVGGVTIVQSGDSLGIIDFAGADGTDAATSAVRIAAEVDGTPGANDMPGRLVFSVTADGASSPTERMRIDSSGRVGIGTQSPAEKLDVAGDVQLCTGEAAGVVKLKGSSFSQVNVEEDLFIDITPSDGFIAFRRNNGASESCRIDGSGRLLVGTSSARSNFFNSTNATRLQTEGTNFEGSSGAFIRNSNDGNSPGLILAKSRGTSVGSNTIVQSGDFCGDINFQGNDGSEFVSAASIAAVIDGTPGANDMPGRLVFSVTADGSASPSEAMRINNAGELLVGYTSDNGAYKLQVNSQIFATSAIIATSDGRYKENVAALDGCVDLVKALRPVSFDWKAQEPVTRVDEDGETVVVREAHNFPDGKQVGFIAQEVEEVLADKPWLGSVIKQNVRPAVTDADGNELAPEEEFLGIAEGNLVAVLTSALKDAIGRIESLEAEVAALKA